MTTTVPDSAFPVAADRCAREILDTVPLVMRVVRAEMRRQGARVVSVPQFRTLLFVARHPASSLAGLAEHLGVTAPTASMIVERLVRDGLLARAADPRERRRIVLTLTPAGVRLVSRLRRKARRQVATRLAGVSGEDLRKIADGLAVLGRLFQEDRHAL